MDQPSPPVPAHQPLTFEERGISLPATTPLLAGTRLRAGQQGLEFVVPNPAGGRGVYILAWAGIKDLWRPSIHDHLLHDAIAVAGCVTPTAVRAAARAVAAGGAAGREARTAAQRALAEEAEARALILRHIAARVTAREATELQAFADVLTAIGFGPRAAQARIPLLLAQMAALRDEVQAWADAHGDETGAVAAIRTASDQAIRGGAKALTEARAQLQDMASLIPAWRTQRGLPGFAINRPDWLLDGWELPCLLWQHCGGVAEQRAAVLEICHLLPVLPKEAAQWIGAPIVSVEEGESGRTIAANTDWRTGLVTMGLTERNEHLRALAA